MLLRMTVGVIGALLIYMAGFLYEDREGPVEGWLGSAWSRVAASVHRLLETHERQARRAPRVVHGWLNQLFGEQPFSARALLVSALLLAGAGLGAAAADALEYRVIRHQNLILASYIVLGLSGMLGIALAIRRFVGAVCVPDRTAIATLVALTVIAGLVDVRMTVNAAVILLITAATFAGVRFVVRRVSEATSEVRRGAILLVGPLMIAALLAIPLAFGDRETGFDGPFFLYYIAVLCSALAFVPTTILLLIHVTLLLPQLLQRIVVRPLHGLRIHSLIFENRAAAFTLGAIMILFAFNPEWFTSNALVRWVRQAATLRGQN